MGPGRRRGPAGSRCNWDAVLASTTCNMFTSGLQVTAETIELQAWQTKTASAAKIRKQPVPLICPKFSFSGKDWWRGLVAAICELAKLPQFKDMGFFIPAIAEDFQGIVARPSAPDRGLRWLKDALIRQNVARNLVDVALFSGIHPRLRLPIGGSPNPKAIPR